MNATKTIHLPLPLSTDAPDPLGLSLVVGFYGPGTWAGWTITVYASWLGVWIRNGADKAVDANTWTYLLGLQWAAIDLIRHLKSLQSLYDQDSGVTGADHVVQQAWRIEASSLAAAFTMVYWGVAHGLLQLVCCSLIRRCRSWQRGVTLAIGLLLPAAGLSVFFFKVMHWESEITDDIPAFYWGGVNQQDHNFGVYIALLTGFWYLLLCSSLILSMLYDISPNSTKKVCDTIIFTTVGVPMFLTPLVKHINFWVFVPFLVVTFLFAFPCVVVVFSGYVNVRALVAYFNKEPAAPGSLDFCFFMPCSRHSITEMEQAGTLFIGLVLFVGAEIVVPLVVKYKKRRATT